MGLAFQEMTIQYWQQFLKLLSAVQTNLRTETMQMWRDFVRFITPVSLVAESLTISSFRDCVQMEPFLTNKDKHADGGIWLIATNLRCFMMFKTMISHHKVQNHQKLHHHHLQQAHQIHLQLQTYQKKQTKLILSSLQFQQVF